jgi:hypothetical protein
MEAAEFLPFFGGERFRLLARIEIRLLHPGPGALAFNRSHLTARAASPTALPSAHTEFPCPREIAGHQMTYKTRLAQEK